MFVVSLVKLFRSSSSLLGARLSDVDGSELIAIGSDESELIAGESDESESIAIESDESLLQYFSSAADFVQNERERISQSDLLILYGLYKQATCGSADSTSRPSLLNYKDRQKYDAWNACSTLSPVAAMAKYVDKVKCLGWSAETKTSNVAGFGIIPSRPMALDEPGCTSGCSEADRWFEAVIEGQLMTVQHLLNENPELVNRIDENGMTGLHWAADRGHVEIVMLLLNNGSSLNAEDDEGQTALQYAVSCGHAKCIELLLLSDVHLSLADESTPSIQTSPDEGQP